ncbi:hypothetical protein MRB53_004953 [Persea americana]|uniref:Uncharacterized protein n=1 Tax=Persea americana TaxID=3435 RepID=A0ACC2MCL7_PERAE|nr:hypothetical protein MRB53_004953 [Persea americana]
MPISLDLSPTHVSVSDKQMKQLKKWRLASDGLLAILVIYLTKNYHIDAARVGSIHFVWSAISNFLRIRGAIL